MIWIHAFLSEVDANVITEPLRVKHLEIAAFGKIAGTAVDNPGVKGDAVSRLHVPAYDVIVVVVVLNVGERDSAVIAEFKAKRPPHSEIRCADDRARLPGSTRRGRTL